MSSEMTYIITIPKTLLIPIFFICGIPDSTKEAITIEVKTIRAKSRKNHSKNTHSKTRIARTMVLVVMEIEVVLALFSNI